MSWKFCWLCCDCKSRGVCPKEGCKQRQPHHGDRWRTENFVARKSKWKEDWVPLKRLSAFTLVSFEEPSKPVHSSLCFCN
jgi:hypothetical protein